ncbi:sucrose phosphorylase [Desulfosarcina ovata subsp. sediminis]|uniref:Sucrose phosphorylase n=1 Tax=Desulfosarcina ovata subsp. sediminis TaxID=885957 RepID=A0A5K7ZGG7_9BACT|nr:sugar phosphorylase [Desulfosarcina ovata]BBO80056.1 sucrose phosphorylase [Desulfosarcina ovata subsp. sediminis]
MKSILQRIYGPLKGDAAFARLTAILDRSRNVPPPPVDSIFTQADAILITYADTLRRPAERPLKVLHSFCDTLKGAVSGIHILPFFPFSSDDGFSVTDFMAVRSDLGSWSDIEAIGRDFKLMVDLVANHVSARSHWFESYLAERQGFAQLAIEVDPATDLSAVTRPRTLPLLTVFEKRSGCRVSVWTTFSPDQVDLNYASLDVLEMMVRALLLYVSKGARLIRLDAIAYLWKTIGTTCIHLPETHDMVRLFRKILDLQAPEVALVTETNVPHAENVSYFGNGIDEAQMVYNFTLPPLLLHALCTGSAKRFCQWVKTLKTPSACTTFFNFTASHDGIGVRPLEGILPPSEISWLADRVRQNGGKVSEKTNPDGSTSPYELNITYLSALKDPSRSTDPLHISRFLASQAVALVLAGVPGIYVHSLLGSPNWLEGVRMSGRARTINRAHLDMDAVLAELADPSHRRARIFHPYLKMLRVRADQPAFHPQADMQVLDLDPRIFGVRRLCKAQTLSALTNFSGDAVTVALPGENGESRLIDRLTGKPMQAGQIVMPAYGTVWLDSYGAESPHRNDGQPC